LLSVAVGGFAGHAISQLKASWRLNALLSASAAIIALALQLLSLEVLAGQTPVQLAGVAAATPPGGAKPIRAGAFDAPTNIPQGQGSNAYALGREVTKTGHGVLLANPHYPGTA
jgi:hypothetical protein